MRGVERILDIGFCFPGHLSMQDSDPEGIDQLNMNQMHQNTQQR